MEAPPSAFTSTFSPFLLSSSEATFRYKILLFNKNYYKLTLTEKELLLPKIQINLNNHIFI